MMGVTVKGWDNAVKTTQSAVFEAIILLLNGYERQPNAGKLRNEKRMVTSF